MGSFKYRKISGRSIDGPVVRTKVVVMQRVSGWDRGIAIANLAITSGIAIYALCVGSLYNSREEARENRRDEATARAAADHCIQYNIDLSRLRGVDANPLYRAAFARQVAQRAIECRRIGHPLGAQIVDNILTQIAAGPGPALVKQAARDALNAVQNERAGPPPTPRERTDAQEALGGRAYYSDRMELEIPLPGGAPPLGIRPSMFVDVGEAHRIEEHPPADPARPRDRSQLEDPQGRGFDIRGVGPRVSRVPSAEGDQTEASN